MFKKLFNVDKMVEQEKQQLLEAQQRVEKREQELKDLQQQVLNRENALLGTQQEVNQLHELAERQQRELTSKLQETQDKLNSLAQKEQELDNELANVQYLDECGFYTDLNQLVFTYGTSQEYKQAIQANLDAQKEMITKNLVCKWGTVWTVEGSTRKGETMMKDTSKMTIRCFNAECNAIIEHMNRTTLEKVNEKIKK